MDIVFRVGRVTASEIHQQLPDPPSYSAVRATLAILKDKGMLTHERVDRKYVYRPTVSIPRAKKQALRKLLNTFFEGSAENLVATLLDPKEEAVTAAEARRIQDLIAEHQDASAESP